MGYLDVTFGILIIGVPASPRTEMLQNTCRNDRHQNMVIEMFAKLLVRKIRPKMGGRRHTYENCVICNAIRDC